MPVVSYRLANNTIGTPSSYSIAPTTYLSAPKTIQAKVEQVYWYKNDRGLLHLEQVQHEQAA